MALRAEARVLKLAHYVSLSGFGGVEQQFAQFAARAAALDPVQQSVVACSGTIHAHHQETLQRVVYRGREKYVRGLKLPHRPAALRSARYRWLAQRIEPDVALLWNRLGQQNRVLDALSVRRCLYWEHGSAWLAGEAHDKERALARMPAVLCNSQAARRMLQLRWGYEGVTRVCLNGMRAATAARAPKTLASGAPLRLGVASRLVPIKATCLALHTLADLHARELHVVLDIAGDGPERKALETLAKQLGVSQSVRFLGVVQDMSAFYSRVDVLLHPALREPFGVVAAEAGAQGVPVICTAVDGLPEVVEHDRTGFCVPAEADLKRYRELGGRVEGLPEYVYVPAIDSIGSPRICEPEALADAVQALIQEPRRYSLMSKNAMARVTKRFDFDAHVRDVLAAAREYAATGTLRVGS